MKKNMLVLSFLICLIQSGFSQQIKNWASGELFENSEFIENKGQFTIREQKEAGSPILYYVRKGKIHMYFTKDALIFRYDSLYLTDENPEEEKEKRSVSNNSEKEEDEIIEKIRSASVFMKMQWLGVSPLANIEVQDPVSNYYTYGDPTDETGSSGILAHAWKKLVYHSLYDGVDLEFYFPKEKEGLKYNIIVHPGADISLFKLKYPEMAGTLIENGNIKITSPCGNFMDHAPIANEENGKNVSIQFSLKNNIVSFQTENYDRTQSLIIDPWITSTSFAKKNKAYDIAHDILGNVYIYGGYTPYQECKYNGSGTLLWTYTTTHPYVYWSSPQGFYGDFEVNKGTGVSYIAEGYNINPGKGPQVEKLDPSGKRIALFPGTSTFNEMWRLKYDYCDDLLVIAGGNNFNNVGQAATLDSSCKNLNFRNVLGANSGQHDMSLLSIPTDMYGKCYMATNASNTNDGLYDNVMISMPLPAFNPTNFQVPDLHKFKELGGNNGTYSYYPIVPVPGIFQQAGNGFNGMASNINMVLTYDGNTLRKWRDTGTNAVLVKTINLGGPSLHWGGLDIDCQGNIYAGYLKSIRVYDSTLNYLGSIPLKDTVYDIRIGPGWNVYSCGHGFVESDKMIFIPTNKQITTTQTNTTTCKSVDGTAHASAVFCEGFPPFTFSWSNGQTGQTATGLAPGSYTVTVRDTSRCNPQRDTAIIHIQGPPGTFTSSAPHTDVLCYGGNNGSATATTSGGSSSFIYSWSNSQTTAVITGLAAGSYTCIISDASSGGCEDSVIVTIAQPPPLKLQGSGSPATCNGLCNGQASIVPSGGTNPYIYSWSNNSSSSGINNLCVGDYSVTLTDLNNCKHDTTIHISEPPAITNKTTSTPAVCGQSNGSASVTASGGTPSFTYSWNNGRTTSNISKVKSGNYRVIIKDSKGCKDTVTVNVPGGSAFTDTPFITDVLCYGDKNGSAAISTSGGVSPFTYTWSMGGSSASISGLAAGSYTCIVNDNSGGNCADTVKIKITQPSPISVQTSSTNVLCFGDCNGKSNVIPAGGTTPYSYSWSTNSTDASVSQLCAGTYSVNISDKNNCKKDTSTSITQPTPITFTKTLKDATCGASNGNASVTPNGGTPGYTYIWDYGATISSISNLTAGKYFLTIKDANGCSDTTSATIINSSPYTLSVTPVNIICFGDNNGSLNLNVNGTSSPYTYSWSNSATTSSISNLSAGEYVVQVKDKDGCVRTITATITQPPPLKVVAEKHTICKGDSVMLTGNVSGGINPYSYSWSSGNTTNSFITTPLTTGNFLLEVTDSNGCKISKTDIVTVVPVPEAAFSGINVCVGIPTVFKDSSFINGGSITSWGWNFGDGVSTTEKNPVHTYNATGTYTVTLTVTNGFCSSTITHVVHVYPLPVADFSVTPVTATILDPIFTITDLSNGGVIGLWDFGDFTSDNYTSGQQLKHTYPTENKAGGETYRIKLNIVNQYGCPDTISKIVHIDPEWTFYVPNTFTPNGDGKNDKFFGTGIGILEKEMWIFDRWGNQIFHTSDLYGGWDGRVQQGNEVNPGGYSNEIAQEDTYVWLIVIKEVFLKTHRLIGHVNIVK